MACFPPLLAAPSPAYSSPSAQYLTDAASSVPHRPPPLLSSLVRITFDLPCLALPHHHFPPLLPTRTILPPPACVTELFFPSMMPAENADAYNPALLDTLVIFDFDCTIIDLDSDPWVVDHLGATELMNSLRTYLPWNDMMDTMMAAFHAQGKTIVDIQESLKTVPFQPEKIAAIKAAHDLGCELRILSDANSFFIDTILGVHDLGKCFTKIHTNPAYIDENNTLRILPFHPKSNPPHGCPLCPPNMCKGSVLDTIMASFSADGNKKRIVYLGDGCGDYCPALRLGVEDYILPREGYPLEELLHENPMQVKAQVMGWKTAQDMADVLLNCLKSERLPSN